MLIHFLEYLVCDAFDLNNGKVAVGVASSNHQKSKLRAVAGANGF